MVQISIPCPTCSNVLDWPVACTCAKFVELASRLFENCPVTPAGKANVFQVIPPSWVSINRLVVEQEIADEPPPAARVVQLARFHFAQPKSAVSIFRSTIPAEFPSWLLVVFTTPLTIWMIWSLSGSVPSKSPPSSRLSGSPPAWEPNGMYAIGCQFWPPSPVEYSSSWKSCPFRVTVASNPFPGESKAGRRSDTLWDPSWSEGGD